LKKRKTEKNNFYKLKKIEKLEKKIIFVKFMLKRSAPKWTSNKMGTPKRATTKRAAPKWLHQKDVLPG